MPKALKRVRKPRPYYVLLTRDAADKPWGIEFGDYDRPAVQFERDDFRQNYAATNLRIIRAENARKSTIDNAVAELNSHLQVAK